jgi:hypothetical protein
VDPFDFSAAKAGAQNPTDFDKLPEKLPIEDPEYFSSLNDETKTAYLAATDDHTLLSYFKDKSFLAEIKLKNVSYENLEEKITPDQKTILLRLGRT